MNDKEKEIYLKLCKFFRLLINFQVITGHSKVLNQQSTHYIILFKKEEDYNTCKDYLESIQKLFSLNTIQLNF